VEFNVLNRYTGDIQFTAEIDCDKTEKNSVKLGMAVKWAVKNRASLAGANLSGANLDGANLSGCNLYMANLSGANLSGANLYKAKLDGASLSGANLSGCNLYKANLSGCNLYMASLSGANLYKANLYKAKLDGAKLDGCNLSGSNLDGARGNNREIKSLHITKYDISYTDTYLQIGCERHKKTEWLEFDDNTISKMDGGALEWWNEWKLKLIDLGIFDEVGKSCVAH